MGRLGLRERHKIATRKALSAAALRLAVERGLENVVIEDIADEAGVSLRTFRNYFSNKYEAICAPAADRAARIGDALRRRPAAEPLWDAITAAVIEQYEDRAITRDRESVAAFRLVTRAPAMRGEYLKVNAAMQRILADAIAQRLGLDADQDLLPPVVAGAVVTATQVAIKRWGDADPPVALRPLVEKALRQLPAALAATTQQAPR